MTCLQIPLPAEASHVLLALFAFLAAPYVACSDLLSSFPPQVLAIVLQKGVTAGFVAEAVGWALLHVLGQHEGWTYVKPAQRHRLAELCVRILRRGLQCVQSAARQRSTNEDVDHRMAFVQALEGLLSGAAYHPTLMLP